MAKLDRFLSQLTAKAASNLRMEPGGYPTLEFPGGHRINLSLQELLGSVLDGLAKEVLPEAQETEYLRGDNVQFTYRFDGIDYYLSVMRSTVGSRIIATHAPIPQAPAPEPDEAPLPEPTSTPTAVAGATSVFELLVAHLLSTGSSDLYLSTDEPPMMRTHGKVRPIPGFPAPRGQDLMELIKAVAPSKAWDDFKKERNAEFIHVNAERKCRLRMTLFEDGQGPAASIRVIPTHLPSPKDLGFTDPLRRIADIGQGLVLFCGAPGSGRTTTLMSLLQTALDLHDRYVYSVETATEFPLNGGETLVRQREVGQDRTRQKKAVRAALRQTPDILSVGEVHDLELLDLALEGAGSGHLVFGTLPAVSVLDGMEFLTQIASGADAQLHRSRLASVLKAMVCQTLLPGIRGGRVAIFETVFVSPTIAGHLREGQISLVPAAMKGGRAYGQRLMNDALVDMVQARLLDPMEAYKHCLDRDGFINACKKGGVDFDPRKAREAKG